MQLNIDRIILQDWGEGKPKMRNKTTCVAGKCNDYITCDKLAKYKLSPSLKIFKVNDIINCPELVQNRFEYVLFEEYACTFFCVSRNMIKELEKMVNVSIYENESIHTIQYMQEFIDLGLIICTNNDFSLVVPKRINNHLIDQLSLQYRVLSHININNKTDSVIIQDVQSEKKMVLKYIKSYNYEKELLVFCREFEHLKKIGYYNTIYKLVKFNPQKYYGITEYIEGQTLSEFLYSYQVDFQDKINIILSIVDTCEYIHNAGFIHGDIHADQFLVQLDGTVKICDLGLSVKIETNNNIISSGGVYQYLAPENIIQDPLLCVCPKTVTILSEIYSIGILIYYIIYEIYPFDDVLWSELYNKIQFIKPTYSNTDKFNNTIPLELIDVIDKCLKKCPQHRYSSIEMLRTEILKSLNI